MEPIDPKLELNGAQSAQPFSPIKAGEYSAAMALFYFIIATLYIYISSKIARGSARTVEELAHIELIKGIVFIFVTSLSMFVFNLFLFRRLRKQQVDLFQHERNRNMSEQVLLAGTFAGSIAHDINNALTVANFAAYEMNELNDLTPRQRELSNEIGKAISSISEWNRRLFDLGGRKLLGESHTIDLIAAIADCVALAKRHKLVRGCTLAVHARERLFVYGSESIIQRALLNLILNAADATKSAGRIDIALSQIQDDFVLLTVSDNGPGVPEAIRARIFEPFYTTKPDGNGLGLASVAACAQAYGGTAAVSSSSLGGAQFSLTLRIQPAGIPL